jgi:two-component system LytT family sensor kinase
VDYLQPVWAGRPADPARAARLVEDVLRADARAGRSGLVALPVRARDELVGVLVVDGSVRLRAAEEAAEWVGEAVEERPRPHRPVLGSRKDGNRNDRPPAT